MLQKKSDLYQNTLIGTSTANVIGNNIGGNLIYNITNHYYHKEKQGLWARIKSIFSKNKNIDIEIEASAYIRKDLPLNLDSSYITRTINFNFFDENLNGLVSSVVGLPKIGKTTLVAQKCKDLKAENVSYYWLDIPYTELEQEEFNKTFFGLLLNIFYTEVQCKVNT